jgi:mitochondrial intermembrane space import and assembly protein 40
LCIRLKVRETDLDPKGVDCVEQFRAMQTCFREHPDVYGEELSGEGEDTEGDEGSDTKDGEKEDKDEKVEPSDSAAHK